jgi:6,7-dimethyl-8-ribityllumazine synthase
MKFAIVVSRYNTLVTKELLGGALDAIERNGGSPQDQLVVWAPGAFEIPILVRAVLEKGGFDAVIALGCVMAGETTHNDYIANEVTKGCGHLSLQYGVPVSFGVLTPNTLEQALNRAGMKMGNKGAESALAAIEAVAAIRAIAKLK